MVSLSIDFRVRQGTLSLISLLIFASTPQFISPFCVPFFKSSSIPRLKLKARIPPSKSITTTLGLHSYSHHSMSSSFGSLLKNHGLPTQPKYAEPCTIGSAQGLARWLSTRMISTRLDMWGVEPGTKNVTNLWVELAEGEITLEDSCPPKRTVNVASVNIKNKSGQVLLESHQEMDDGSTRFRNRPLSEKMKAGETVEEACRRGICEELGLVLGSPDKIELFMDSYERKVEERDSLSYPGLLTCYVVHSVNAFVADLPETDFFTDEDEDGRINGNHGFSFSSSGSREKAVGVKRHFWKWVPDNAQQQEI